MPDTHWKGFLVTLIGTTVVTGAAVYLFVLLADPYRNVPFSPPAARLPVDKNQRFSFPGIARDQQFDSGIFGTSSVGLLDPEYLDPLLGVRLANLALHAGTAYEQARLGRLFLEHHPDARMLIFGLDSRWCDNSLKPPRLTHRLFPEWLYDKNRWNDLLYLFNERAVANAWAQSRAILARLDSRYRADGYRNFLPPDSLYAPERALKNIYADADPVPIRALPAPDLRATCDRPEWRYKPLELLEELLHEAPQETLKVLVFVPYHVTTQRKRREVLTECKGQVAQISERTPNMVIVDFMQPSAITTKDENYWDSLHYRIGVARELEIKLAEGVREHATYAVARVDQQRPY